MARVTTYLNFMGNAEEAFDFYRSVFGTDYTSPITHMGDLPMPPGAPAIAEADLSKVMHAELPILAGHVLMASDMLESMGHSLKVGNNVTINLEPDTRDEVDRLYRLLSEGGSEGSGLADMPWGAYWGSCLDRFGTRWMFNFYTS